jgi:hypothetical protein
MWGANDTVDALYMGELGHFPVKREVASGEERYEMATMVLEFTNEEAMRIEAILMDNDAEEALRFLRQVVRPKIRSKRSNALDIGKSTGIMT